MNNSALILMTTYNGEKYLSKQMDSILDQTYQNWKLVVRDDGSKDNTIKILERYAHNEPRITIIKNDTKRHGAYLNFWTLIHDAREKYSNYDYFFFSDQDDMWDQDKLAMMISEAEKYDENRPLLLYADMSIIDQDNKVIYESLNKVMGIGEISGYSLFYTHGFLWGCDICANNCLFNSIPLLPLNHPYINIMSHDNYIGKYALIEGEIRYLDKKLVNHRRHGDNTTSEYLVKLNPAKILRKAVLQFNDLAKTHARVYNQTLIFIMQINEMGKMSKRIQDVQVAIRKGGIVGYLIMKKNRVKRKQISRTIGIYVVMLFCLYKRWLVI